MSHLGLFKAVLDFFLHIKSVYLTDSFLQRNVIVEKCTWQNNKKQQNFVTHYPWDLGRVHGNNENINMATTTYTWSV